MLTKSIDDMQKNIGSVIYKIKQGIDVINNEINKISDGSANLSDRSKLSSQALEELASSIEALSSSLKENCKKRVRSEKYERKSVFGY